MPLLLFLRQSQGGAAPPFPPSYDYYVNQASGSDGNNGLSPGAAFETLSAAQTAALAHGNGARIGLARGSEWREELELSSLSNVTVGAYGDGKIPILRGDDVLESGDFTNDVTHTNTWRVSWTPPDAIEGVAPNVFVDGVRLTRAASAAACDAAAGTYYSNNVVTVGVAQDVYIHPPGSTNPTSDGKVYEITRRNYAIRVGDGARITGLNVRRGCSFYGALFAGVDVDVRGCVVLDGAKHGLVVGSGLVEDTYIIGGDDSWVVWGGGTGAHIPAQAYTPSGSGLNMTWRRCVTMNNPATFAIPGSGGFHAHGVGADTYNTITYEDCQAYYGHAVFRGVDCQRVIVNRCLGYECSTFTGVGTATDPLEYICEDSELYRTFTGVASLYARMVTMSRGALTIRRLRSVYPNQSIVYHSGNEDLSVEITDSIIAVRNRDGTGVHGILMGEAGSTANIALVNRRNVFDGFSGSTVQRVFRLGAGTALTIDTEDNVFAAETDRFELLGGSHANVTNYRAANPTLDLNSVVGAPGWVDDPVNRDYSLDPEGAAAVLGAGQVGAFQHDGDYATLLAAAMAL